MSLWIKSLCVTIQLKIIEQYSPLVLFILLYTLFLICKSADEILQCDHSLKHKLLRSTFLLFMLYKVVLTLKSLDEI